MLIRSVVANGISAAIITRPAPVVGAAVSRSPIRTASWPPTPATYASRVRISSSVEYATEIPKATVKMLIVEIGSR